MIRKATAADLDGVTEIYDAILNREERTGKHYTNWQRGLYPTRDTARRALEAGTLFVDERGGEIAAAANLNGVQPTEYINIPWAFPADRDEVLVIHTLVVHPLMYGRGVARRFVAFAEGYAAGLGKTAIRLDTYEGNEPAKAMYPKLGYTMAGDTFFHFEGCIDETLTCYEKKV